MISTQNQTQIYVKSNILQQMIIINQNNDFITEIDILPGKKLYTKHIDEKNGKNSLFHLFFTMDFLSLPSTFS